MKYLILFCFTILLFGCKNEGSFINVDYIKFENKIQNKEFYGIIKAQNSSLLSFQAEGKIEYFPYTKGDFIKKGDVIARLDSALYTIKKNEEKAKLERYIVEENKQKKYYKRLDILHKEGAISDNDWENAYFELKTLNKDIQTQKEKIKYIDKEISYNILTAPYDGYITEKFSDVNSIVKIGTPITGFISSNALQTEIMVDENVINDVKLNDKVEIKVQNKFYKGKISHISKSSLNSGGYLIKISFDSSIDSLKEGMSTVVILKNKKIATLPLECIFEENNQKFIYKIINVKNKTGEVKKEYVTTGKIINNEIEILDGIKQNDLIITKHFFDNYKNKKVKL